VPVVSRRRLAVAAVTAVILHLHHALRSGASGIALPVSTMNLMDS
jgi:hypothetical protein